MWDIIVKLWDVIVSIWKLLVILGPVNSILFIVGIILIIRFFRNAEQMAEHAGDPKWLKEHGFRH